jgi:hypothetical protein
MRQEEEDVEALVEERVGLAAQHLLHEGRHHLDVYVCLWVSQSVKSVSQSFSQSINTPTRHRNTPTSPTLHPPSLPACLGNSPGRPTRAPAHLLAAVLPPPSSGGMAD